MVAYAELQFGGAVVSTMVAVVFEVRAFDVGVVVTSTVVRVVTSTAPAVGERIMGEEVAPSSLAPLFNAA